MGSEASAAVRELNPSRKRGTFFQGCDWLALWDGRSGYKAAVCLLESGDQTITYFPFCRRSRFGFSECFSMPMGTYGGAVSLVDDDDNDNTTELTREFVRWCDTQNIDRINVVEYTSGENNAYSGFTRNDPTTHVLNLDTDEAILHRDLSNNHRRNIDKAAQTNFAIVPVRSTSDVEAYFELVKEGADRHGSKPRYNLAFYLDMLAIVASDSLIWQIVYAGDRACCGHIYFTWNGEAIYWDGCSSEIGLDLRANFYLFWSNILSFKNDSISKLNYGASPSGAISLVGFKEGWGAKEASYNEYDRQNKLYGGLKDLRGRIIK